jgi:NADPH:quinone reductase-like Zn-dependent oxidoreductase
MTTSPRTQVRPLTEAAEDQAQQLLTLTGLIEAGKLTPVLDRTYPLADTAEGLRRVEQGHARGKVVITVAQDRRGRPGTSVGDLHRESPR